MPNNNNLDVLLSSSNRANNCIDTAISKLINISQSQVSQSQENDQIQGVIKDLLVAQLELVGLDKGIIENLEPNNVKYLNMASNRILETQAKQNEILNKVVQQNQQDDSYTDIIL